MTTPGWHIVATEHSTGRQLEWDQPQLAPPALTPTLWDHLVDVWTRRETILRTEVTRLRAQLRRARV